MLRDAIFEKLRSSKISKHILSDKQYLHYLQVLFTGYNCMPLSQTQFLEEIITAFEALELNDELYVPGDFNINSLLRSRCILNKTHKTETHCEDLLPKTKKYNEFCLIYGFKQLINCPAKIIYNTSTLIDHILTNAQDNISQFGVINTATILY